jgi:hypothetical protein
MENYKYIPKNTNIFMIHGLASFSFTFYPLKLYLQKNGYTNIHGINYPVNTYEFDQSLDFVNSKILEIIPDENTSIVVIGQSFGGLICNNLHKKGRNVLKSICICSPLHGAKLVNMVEYYLPDFIKKIINRTPYDFLKDKDKDEIPPHDFHTISFGLFNTDFDECVYKEESILDENKHTHISWSSHMAGFLDLRLFRVVYNVLEMKLFTPYKSVNEEEKPKKVKYLDL